MSVLLYNRSAHSLMSSSLTIPELVGFCAENGYKACALTDRNVFSGAMELYHCCNTAGIKPVFGLETDVIIEEKKYPFVLYARNVEGYIELLHIASFQKELSVEELLERSENLVVVELFTDGYLEYLINMKEELIRDHFRKCRGIKYYFVGLEAGKNEYLKIKNRSISEICRNNNIRTVAMPKVLYSSADREEGYAMVRSVQNNYEQYLIPANDRDSYLRGKDELFTLFDTGAVFNTDVIADMCDVDIDKLPKASLPKFETPNNVASKYYLYNLCMTGLKKRLGTDRPDETYSKRLEYELQVIVSMHFEDYFLIVWDIVLFARRNNIQIGVGRGSAAGCLAAYCLGITHIDPIKNNLYFERFLNPERLSLPDIDIDFSNERRDEIYSYVISKYGKEFCCHIATYNTFGPRLALNDCAKVMGIQERTLNIILSFVPRNGSSTLKEMYEGNAKFQTAINSSQQTMKLYSVASMIEGLPKNISMHPAGIVISDIPVNDIVPVYVNENFYSSQFSKEYLEELGLVKIDILSLADLTVMVDMINLVSEYEGEEIQLMSIPMNDRKSFNVINELDTLGIFQLDTEVSKSCIRQVKPSSFAEMTDIIALVRPGAYNQIDQYVRNKNNPNEIKYINKDLKGILEPTYGIMIYQEQVMQIAQVIAGFEFSKADILRKAISSKNPELMEQMKNDFINGGLAKGHSENNLQQIFDLILKFGGYGFNKAHAVSYATLVLQMAYLKAHHPQYFYCVGMRKEKRANAKMAQYITEARKYGIEVLGPDVNSSQQNIMPEGRGIRLPLSFISNVNIADIDKIFRAREKAEGSFRDYVEFISHTHALGLRTEAYQYLIKSGSCDCFGISRTEMLNKLHNCINYSELIVNVLGQLDFSLAEKPFMDGHVRDNPNINSKQEFELLKLYLKKHPAEEFRSQYPDAICIRDSYNRFGSIELIVVLSSIKEHYTRSREELMAFATGDDETGSIDLVLFNQVYLKYRNILKRGSIYLVRGKLDNRNSVLVNDITLLKGE